MEFASSPVRRALHQTARRRFDITKFGISRPKSRRGAQYLLALYSFTPKMSRAKLAAEGRWKAAAASFIKFSRSRPGHFKNDDVGGTPHFLLSINRNITSLLGRAGIRMTGFRPEQHKLPPGPKAALLRGFSEKATDGAV
jgi:hypothetical protein